ncbi:MAG: dephospho-CoA kinase [Actinomycetota bacterium]|nr:dephospho-CoA kinase [Actinomycetota bacterium]
MILVGLTGGIGSGKSTVSSMLAARGAEIIDADAITREVQQPGSQVVEAIAERFGDQVLDGDRGLLRAKLAEIVFSDPEALRDLNAIVHPAVGAEINRRVRLLAGTDKVVVLDIPLLTENPRQGLQGKIVVDVPIDVQVDRLVRYRGFTEGDARARIARQAGKEDRLRDADFVIDNAGTIDVLCPQVAALWERLTSLPQLPDDFRLDRRSA